MRMKPFLLVLPLLLASWPGAGYGQQAKEEEKETVRPQSVQSVQSLKPVQPLRPAKPAKPAQQTGQTQQTRQTQQAPASTAARLRPGIADQANPGAISQQSAFKRELGVAGGLRFEQLRAMRSQAEAQARNRNATPGVVPQNRRDYRRQPADCDDNDRAVHPGQVEVCNFRDDDCDGDVDEGVTWTVYRDQDGDGFGDPAWPVLTCPVGEPLANVATNNRDCDDTDRARNPSLGTCP